MCDPTVVTGALLVARLHVDLQRVTSAACLAG
ncbi:MAG: putative leader peptide [Mycobacteriales bacterium]